MRRPIAFLLTMLLPATAAAQAVPDLGDVGALLTRIRWYGVLMAVVVVIGASIVLRFIAAAANRLGRDFAARRLLIRKVESFAQFFIYFTTAAVALALIFPLEALVLIGGTLVVAVGLAMKDLIAAVIAGVTVMFDRPFQVGDRVQYAGEYGDVIQIGLRSVRMRTLDDNIVTIPNNKILTDVTSSGNYGELDMQVAMRFYIGADQDFELAERLVYEAMLTSRYVFLEKPAEVLLQQVFNADFVALQLTGKAYVLDTKYEKAFETDVCKRVLGAFRDHRILPPAAFQRTRGEVAPRRVAGATS